ncbi:Extracellular Matrix protein PelA [hydrothermal vent metagenome]|uniref:Extracellular Matrix protein PelA n=1 Tax=hydrothermal vent metagenome TaxID=652676 RepID=A0A1W1D3J3_9ZZZZ
MKLLCCSKIFIFLFIITTTLFASLSDKSAIFYYGKDISYPMVGIHDYIVVDPKNINTLRHGFSLYKHKIYARITGKNLKEIKKALYNAQKKGFENFFFDIFFLKKTKKISQFLQYFSSQYPQSKIMILARKKLLQKVSSFIDVIVVESFLEKNIDDLKLYNLDIIDIEYTNISDIEDINEYIKKIQKKGMIPYITDIDYSIYGKSSKNAIKREILTLVNETHIDRILLASHKYGALPLEYMGYIQKLYNISKGLPNPKKLQQYAGVIVWIDEYYKDSQKFLDWLQEVKKQKIKIVFINNFGTEVDNIWLKQFDIDISYINGNIKNTKKIIQQSDMIGFEAEPSLNTSNLYMMPNHAKPLYIYEDANKQRTIPAAITKWGGYAMYEAVLTQFNGQNVWVMNPFLFFQKSLRLQSLLVPDPTTENGKRLLFSHVDGDGLANYVEFSPRLVSGEIIYNNILSQYKIPISVSVIGAEINKNGPYPKFFKRLEKIIKKSYKLSNVEGATHTFSRPFFWGKIVNDTLSPNYRLKVKNYKFSLKRELFTTLQNINQKYMPKNKPKAKMVFWSGDCAPRVNALEFIYKHHILNINGGNTSINNMNPWLTNIAPFGLQRDGYIQIYAGAQDENVFTNNWFGPFWGFKRVVQTFQLTNSPRRFKPIDIHYHFYSGSKLASLNALKYVYNWAIKQDVMPVYTSAYIPKVMDYYDVSMAREGNVWLIDGMRDLRTLRIEKKNALINLQNSKTVLGVKHFENHTYISLDQHQRHIIDTTPLSDKKEAYLISANGRLLGYKNNGKKKEYSFKGEVDLKLSFYLPKNCIMRSNPRMFKQKHQKEDITLLYKTKKANVRIMCP